MDELAEETSDDVQDQDTGVPGVPDPYFSIEVLSSTEYPQTIVYQALHQCYSSNPVSASTHFKALDEKACGDIIVRRLLAGNRGHYSPLEMATVVLSCKYFNHGTVQQITRHRTGISFSVQCLGGDTEITFTDKKGESGPRYKRKLADLYDLWANGEKAIRTRADGSQYRRDGKTRIKKMYLRVMNNLGFFEISHIKEVICSGVQPTYKVLLEDGKHLICTANHRIFTSDGWQTLAEATGIVLGTSLMTKECKIMCNGAIVGDGIYQNKSWLEKRIAEGLNVQEMADIANCSIETIKKWSYHHGLSINKRKSGSLNPWNKNKGGYSLNISPEGMTARRENGKRRKGESSNFWRGDTRTIRQAMGGWTRQQAPQVHAKYDYTCQKCAICGGSLVAHHLVPIFADPSLAYEFDNLITLCSSCHRFIHANHLEAEFVSEFKPLTEIKDWKNKHLGRTKLKAHPVKVVKVQYVGEQMTYDIEVENPHHNFVANGMVVHNSFRYTSDSIIKAATGSYEDVEKAFYLRPLGRYMSRNGCDYEYTEKQRAFHLEHCRYSAQKYAKSIEDGMAEEQARGFICYDYRQHFIMGLNARTLCHLLDMRAKKDAQLEIQWFSILLLEKFREFMPEVCAWYQENRYSKARLAP